MSEVTEAQLEDIQALFVHTPDAPEEVAVTIRDPRADGNSLSYQVNVLDGTLRTSINRSGCAVYRPLRAAPLPVSAAGTHRRERRRSRSSERAAGPPAFEPWPHR